MTRDLRQTVREVLEEPGAYIGGRERAILAKAIADDERAGPARRALDLAANIKLPGHAGDEESGWHDEDCQRCAIEALIAMLTHDAQGADETTDDAEGAHKITDVCEHGHPAAIAHRVVLGRGCALCLAGVVDTIGGGSDAVWWGRQIERQAQRATEAIARAQRAEEERAGLAARLEHFEGVGQNLARALEQNARTRNETDELAREADELTRRANEAIPFGPDAVDEPTIAAWRDRARVLLEIRDRFLKAEG